MESRRFRDKSFMTTNTMSVMSSSNCNTPRSRSTSNTRNDIKRKTQSIKKQMASKLLTYSEAKKKAASFFYKQRAEFEKERRHKIKVQEELEKIEIDANHRFFPDSLYYTSSKLQSVGAPATPLAAWRPRGLMAYDFALNPKVEKSLRDKRYMVGYGRWSNLTGVATGSGGGDGSRGRCGLQGTTRPGYRGLPGMQQTKEFQFKRTMSRIVGANGRSSLPWLELRLEASVRPHRFALPFPIELFKGMKPMAYLKKYCFVCPEIKSMLKERYKKYTNKTKSTITHEELFKELKRKLCDTPPVEELEQFLELLGLGDTRATYDLAEFVVVLVAAERVLYRGLTKCLGPGLQLSFAPAVERADMCGLERRLAGLTLRPNLLTLLYSLH